MNLYKKLTILLLLSSAFSAMSQQAPHFSLNYFNRLYYNAAFAGVEGVTKVQFLHRTQWVGFPGGGNPTSQVLSINAPILRLKSGVGFHLVNDALGPQNNVQAQAAYAYHLQIGNKTRSTKKLSLGARVGVLFQSINSDELIAVDPNDPVILGANDVSVNPDFGVGAYFQAQKYYIGISVNHLTEAQFDFGLGEQIRNSFENVAYLVAGYTYDVNFNFKVTPNVLIQSDFNTTSFDIGILGEYQNKISAGLAFRRQEAVIALFGYKLLEDNRLEINSAVDYVTTAQDAKATFSFEIGVSYILPVAPPVLKKIQRSPRFSIGGN